MDNFITSSSIADIRVNGVHEKQELQREKLSGIDVLIVGAGLGGLNAAIEIYRQGHNVRLVEAKSQMEGLVGKSSLRWTDESCITPAS